MDAPSLVYRSLPGDNPLKGDAANNTVESADGTRRFTADRTKPGPWAERTLAGLETILLLPA